VILSTPSHGVFIPDLRIGRDRDALVSVVAGTTPDPRDPGLPALARRAGLAAPQRARAAVSLAADRPGDAIGQARARPARGRGARGGRRPIFRLAG